MSLQDINDKLQSYTSYRALFFTADGIIIEKNTRQIFLPLLATKERLQLVIHDAHFNGKFLIIKCETSLMGKKIVADAYRIHPVKALLSTVDAISQKNILTAYHWLNWDRQSKFCG